MHPNQHVEVAVRATVAAASGSERRQVWFVEPLKENVYRPVMEGYRQGDDARDVLADAIHWWASELDGLEAACTSQMPAT